MLAGWQGRLDLPLFVQSRLGPWEWTLLWVTKGRSSLVSCHKGHWWLRSPEGETHWCSLAPCRHWPNIACVSSSGLLVISFGLCLWKLKQKKISYLTWLNKKIIEKTKWLAKTSRIQIGPVWNLFYSPVWLSPSRPTCSSLTWSLHIAWNSCGWDACQSRLEPLLVANCI